MQLNRCCCAKVCTIATRLASAHENYIHARAKQFSCGLIACSQDKHGANILYQLRKAMTMKLTVMSMLLSALIAMPSYADTKVSGGAVLATPVSQPSETLIKGVAWRCEANRCTPTKQVQGVASFIKQCRNVATVVGPLVAFNNGSRNASDSEIATCNKLAQESKG
jgi:hypothetical protein